MYTILSKLLLQENQNGANEKLQQLLLQQWEAVPLQLRQKTTRSW